VKEKADLSELFMGITSVTSSSLPSPSRKAHDSFGSALIAMLASWVSCAFVKTIAVVI
jgi:hypothetical protein